MKYPKLYHSFNLHINLPLAAYLDIESRLIKKSINKKEFLIQEGNIIGYLPFINKGLMSNYRVDSEGNRHVIQISWTGGWLGDLNSFFSGNSTLFNIQAHQDTELLLISHDTFEYITQHYPILERYFRICIQNAYAEILNRVFRLHSKSPKNRYLELVEKVPSILDDMPHYLIASYLGIQPQSLSRIRKNL